MNKSLIVSNSLFVLSTMAILLAVAAHPSARRTLTTHWRAVLVVLAINLFVKVPINQPWFHGLEYEDCFVHQAVARQLQYGHNPLPDALEYREAVFSIGSLEDGEAHQSFYHTIGYAGAIRLLQEIFGDSPVVGHLLSLAASCAAVVLVFLLAAQLRVHAFLPHLAAIVYTCIPVANCHAATTSAEVFSSFFLTGTMVVVYLAADASARRGVAILQLVALWLTLAFAILVERENVVLAFLLPFVTCFAGSAFGKRALVPMARRAAIRRAGCRHSGGGCLPGVRGVRRI